MHFEEAGLENSNFGQTPIIVDFNQDAKPDVVWLNMNGPVRAFFNASDVDGIAVRVSKNGRFLGGSGEFTSDGKSSYRRSLVSGVGLMSDQTGTLFFSSEPGDASSFSFKTIGGEVLSIESVEPGATCSIK